MIIPYLSDMINDHKIEEQKLQLGMRVNFISSKDTGEIRTTYILMYEVITKKLGGVVKPMIILINFLNLF